MSQVPKLTAIFVRPKMVYLVVFLTLNRDFNFYYEKTLLIFFFLLECARRKSQNDCDCADPVPI